MQIFRGLKNIPDDIANCAVTIGNFDGVHLGHHQIINNVIKKAQESGLKSAIVTFAEHPIKLFAPKSAANFLIYSLSQKLKFLKQFEIDYLIILPFNKKIANISAKNFVKEILVEKIKAKELIIGYDFIFGKNREGNFEFLQKQADELNFNLSRTLALTENDEILSSTLIRKFIKAGELEKANKILGKEFEVEGIINQGNKNGHKIGFPTMNLHLKELQIAPKFGVYKSRIYIKHLDKEFNSVTNFGIRPTIDDDKSPLYETHIIDLDREKYGSFYYKKIVVKLEKFIRGEIKFESFDELRDQIATDIEACR